MAAVIAYTRTDVLRPIHQTTTTTTVNNFLIAGSQSLPTSTYLVVS
jgi:hypothetical protein